MFGINPVFHQTMAWRFWLVVGIALAVFLIFAPRNLGSADQAVDKAYLAKVASKVGQLADAADTLQEEIVESFSGVKEKQVFAKVDQVLHALAHMEKTLSKAVPAREDIYDQFDGIDGKVSNLRAAAAEMGVKHPALLRGADRVRALTDDLHFVVSAGDSSPKRMRQALARQVSALGDVTKKLSRTAQYALGDVPGRGELLADMQKLAEACGNFATVVETAPDLEKCRKEFSSLNNAWVRVVRGISLLPPAQNVYLLRGGIRADAIHDRLFRTLEIKGQRSVLTIRI